MHPLLGLLVSLIMPWRACQRSWQRTGVLFSMLYHVAGVVLFLIGLLIVDTMFWYGDIADAFTMSHPGEMLLLVMAIATWAISIELAYLLLALMTSCWGAGQEPFGHSVGRSLSRWYQLTPFIAVWVLGFIIAIAVLDEIRWGQDFDYSTLSYEVWELILAALTLAPFVMLFGVGGWFILRALAVPRDNAVYYPKSRWPALCETCGYTLLGLARDQSCPECGRSIESSLTTDRGNHEHNLRTKMVMALFQPSMFGRIVKTHTRTSEPAKALAITALLLLLTGPVGVFIIFITMQVAHGSAEINSLKEFLQVFLIGGLGTGLGAVVVGVFFTLFAGSLIGLIDRVFGKRNNLPAACQAACFASGYSIGLVMMLYVLTALFGALVDYLFNRFGYGVAALLPLIWIVILLMLVIPFTVIVGRAVRSMRFANC